MMAYHDANRIGYNLGELLAWPVVVYSLADHIRGRGVIWFIDNSTALSTLIKAESATKDGSHMAMTMSLSLMALECRCWFEHLDSALNPSDVLSRDGYEDLAVQAAIAAGKWTRIDPEVPWMKLIKMSPDEYLAGVSALED
jgi:hypothetical protein